MKPSVLIPTFLASAALTQAEVLAHFTFDGDSAASSDTSKYSSATTWNLSKSAEANTISRGVSTVHANQDVVPAGISATNVNPSNKGAQWQQFQFTIQNLAAGETLTLTTFKYDYGRIKPLNFESAIYSNLSGYMGSDDSIGGTANASSNGSNPTSKTLKLSSTEFKGLTNGDVVEFRIYLKDSSTKLSSRIHKLDNISLEGRVVSAVESLSSALISFGDNTLILRR
ncbi:hypothetical protein [Rubritalea sp.]|uniref:hypothetical protein n=1 Tax=Rubritalea sp. TaxID=2109375 RepID=UPI003EF8E693